MTTPSGGRLDVLVVGAGPTGLTLAAQLHAGGRIVRVRLFGLGLDDTAYPFLLFVSPRPRPNRCSTTT